MTDLPTLSALFDRFQALVMALVGSLGVRVGERAVPRDIGEEAGRRVRGVRNLVEMLFLKLRDGSLADWLVRSAGRRGFRVVGRRAVGPRVWMPRRVGWLCNYLPCTARYPDSAGYYAGRLTALLGEAEVRRLLASCPRLGLALRPLCRMLGVDAALYLDVTPPAEEESAAPPPRVEPAPAALPEPDPPPVAVGDVIPWYHQKWAQ